MIKSGLRNVIDLEQICGISSSDTVRHHRLGQRLKDAEQSSYMLQRLTACLEDEVHGAIGQALLNALDLQAQQQQRLNDYPCRLLNIIR